MDYIAYYRYNGSNTIANIEFLDKETGKRSASLTFVEHEFAKMIDATIRHLERFEVNTVIIETNAMNSVVADFLEANEYAVNRVVRLKRK